MSIERFRKYVHKSSDPKGCWEWKDRIYDNGYGQFHEGTCRENYKTVLAHRYSYEIYKGPIEQDLEIDRLCRNRSCVNPEHLEAVTRLENVRRAAAHKTHCPHGHAYTQENTSVYKGKRRCMECQRQRARDKYRMLNPDYVPKDAVKTHCKHGHDYTGDNILIRANGHKECRECVRIQNRNRRKK